MKVCIAVDSDGTRAGVGATPAWARFDAAREALWSSYAIDSWGRKDVLSWAREIEVAELQLEAASIPMVLAALFDRTLEGGTNLHDELGVQARRPEPPWASLGQMQVSDEIWADDVDHEDADESEDPGMAIVPVGYRRVNAKYGAECGVHRVAFDGRVFRMTGFQISRGDQLEVLLDQRVLELNGIKPEISARWVAGTIVRQRRYTTAEPCLVLRPTRGHHIVGAAGLLQALSDVLIPAGAEVLPIRSLGGRIEPLMDRAMRARGESWTEF